MAQRTTDILIIGAGLRDLPLLVCRSIAGQADRAGTLERWGAGSFDRVDRQLPGIPGRDCCP